MEKERCFINSGTFKKKKKKHSLSHFIFCCCFDDEGIINYEWPDVYFLSLLSCVE